MITRSHALHLRSLIEKAAVSLTDEEALTGIELFPAWKTETSYEATERVRYDGKLYRCEQSHTSQASWTPDITPALWTPVSIDEYPDWVQPTGVQDAYRIGDKVTYNGQHWVCTLDYNVYPPDVTGWELVE